MKVSFKSLLNVLKFGGAYTSASITCLFTSLCFYYVAYSNRDLRDVTFDVCASALSLSCCIVLMSIVASSYIFRIIKDINEEEFKKDNNKTVNLFIFLHKMYNVFTYAGCVSALAIGVYVIVYTVLDTIS